MNRTSEQENNTKKKMTSEIEEFIEASILYLKSMGAFAKKVGEVEKKYPEAFEMMEKMSSPEALTEFVEKLPPDILVTMLKLLIRAGGVSSKMRKEMSELTPDEKIEIGKELIAMANDISKLMKKTKE